MDKVCERHFRDDEILTHWSHLIGGKIFQLKRDKPKLKSTAIPSLNLPELSTLVTLDRINAKQTKQNAPRKRTLKSKTQQPAKKVCTAKKRGILSENTEAKNDVNDLDATKNDGIEILPDDSQEEEEHLLETASVDSNDVNEMRINMFRNLFENVFDVILPTSLWGIHRDPDAKYIAFTMFDPAAMTTTKVLYVNESCESQVYIGGSLLSNGALRELNVDIVTELLNDLDAYEEK